MGQRLSALEFEEWLAYNAIDPIGLERADAAAGIVASVIANVNRDPKKKPDPFTAADFMPRYDRKRSDVPPESKWQQQKAAFKALMKRNKP